MTLPIDTVISSRSSRRTISTATVGIRGPAGPTGATGPAGDIADGGNSPTANLVLGTLNNFGISWIFNNVEAFLIDANGALTAKHLSPRHVPVLDQAGKVITDSGYFEYYETGHTLLLNADGDIYDWQGPIGIHGMYDTYLENSLTDPESDNIAGVAISSSRGTGPSPEILQADDLIGHIGGYGYMGTVPEYRPLCSIRFHASSVTTDVNNLGGSLRFFTTTPGNTQVTEAMRINRFQNLLIGQTLNSAGNEKVQVTGNVKVTGSIVVSGDVDGRDVSLDGIALDNHLVQPDAHPDYILAAGTRAFTGNVSMGNNKIRNLPNAVNNDEPATYEQLLNAISGQSWQPPIHTPSFTDDSLSTPPISPQTDAVYAVGPAATGAWTGLEGHLVYWDGAAWQDQGVIQLGDRYIVTAEDGAGDEGGSCVGKHDYTFVVTNATPGSYAYTQLAPQNNWTVLCDDPNSPCFGDTYNYNGDINQWVEISSPGQITAGTALAWDGKTLNVQIDGTTIVLDINGKLSRVPATKSEIGLGNVDNTSDLNKPISTATQAALDLKAPINNPTFTGTVGGITKSMVGLGNADNTSDADKPVSDDTQAALDLKAPINNPTFTGTVNGISAAMVGLGNVNNTSDLNKPISTATQSALDLKAPLDSPTFTGTVGGITKSMVGLGNVDNTSDLNKPVSTATQSALDLKVDDTEKGAANGVATLDASGDVPITQINLPSSTVSANAAATTTSTTPVLLTGMTITPGAGTYMVVFGSDFTLGSNAQIITSSIFINGVQDAGSIRSAGAISSGARIVITTFAVAVVAAGQTIEGRWQVNSGTGTSTNRSLRLVRIA